MVLKLPTYWTTELISLKFNNYVVKKLFNLSFN